MALRPSIPEINIPATEPELVSDDKDSFKDRSNIAVSEVGRAAPAVTSVDNEGPIVTRRELWAYYRA
jgi:hypothetical protein